MNRSTNRDKTAVKERHTLHDYTTTFQQYVAKKFPILQVYNGLSPGVWVLLRFFALIVFQCIILKEKDMK